MKKNTLDAKNKFALEKYEVLKFKELKTILGGIGVNGGNDTSNNGGTISLNQDTKDPDYTFVNNLI